MSINKLYSDNSVLTQLDKHDEASLCDEIAVFAHVGIAQLKIFWVIIRNR